MHCSGFVTPRSCRYDQYADAWDTSCTLNILGEEVRFFHSNKKGVDRVWVDNPMFLAKVRPRELACATQAHLSAL